MYLRQFCYQVGFGCSHFGQPRRQGSREVEATFPEESAFLCLESSVATIRPNLQRTRAAPLHLFGNFLFGNNNSNNLEIISIISKLQIENKEIPCTLYPDSPITYILLYFFHCVILFFLNCLKASYRHCAPLPLNIS